MAEKDSNQLSFEDIQSLKEEINNLRRDIDQSYYRIPKQEFENNTVMNITQKVTEQINKRFNVWRNWIGVVLVVFSTLGIFQGFKLTDQIDEFINKANKDTEEKIDKLSKDLELKIGFEINKMNSNFNETKSAIEDNIEGRLENLRKFQSDELKNYSNIIDSKTQDAAAKAAENQISNIRNDINTAYVTALKIELRDIQNSVNQKHIQPIEGIYKLEPLLEKAKKTNDEDLVLMILDELFALNFLAGKYEKLDELGAKYEKDYDLNYLSLANIAVADMHLYQESNSLIYKNRALIACKKSLEKLPTYGAIHAIRLLIHAIDYFRTNDISIKEKELIEAGNLIDKINQGTSYVTTVDAYLYLLDVQQKEYIVFGEYIELLYEKFPLEMQKMEDRYTAYMQRTK